MTEATGSIVVMGCGALGSALVRGMAVNADFQKNLVLFDVDTQRAQALAQDCQCQALSDLKQGQIARTLLFAVKPADLDTAIVDALPLIDTSTLIVSCAAGRSIQSILDVLHPHIPGLPVLRAMPNVAAQVGSSVTALVAGPGVEDEDRALVAGLFATVGSVHHFDHEHSLHAVTALAASGPAFAALILEALIDAGVRAGLRRNQAQELSLGMWQGTLKLVAKGQAPADLRALVTSPGGTTAAGLALLERGALRGLISDAIVAAAARSEQLAG